MNDNEWVNCCLKLNSIVRYKSTSQEQKHEGKAENKKQVTNQ